MIIMKMTLEEEVLLVMKARKAFKRGPCRLYVWRRVQIDCEEKGGVNQRRSCLKEKTEDLEKFLNERS